MTTIARVLQSIITAANGLRPAAREIGVDHSELSRWRATGRIPVTRMKCVLGAARKFRVAVKAEDLIP